MNTRTTACSWASPGISEELCSWGRGPASKTESTLLLVRKRARHHRSFQVVLTHIVNKIRVRRCWIGEGALRPSKKVGRAERRLPGLSAVEPKMVSPRSSVYFTGINSSRAQVPSAHSLTHDAAGRPFSPLQVSRRGRRWYLMYRRYRDHC